jgi:IS1 family transposase
VQFDEKWSFVAKKVKNCDRSKAADDAKGECRDHVALDPESRLVVSAKVGRRTPEHTRMLVEDFRRRAAGRVMNLMTSDEYPQYATAIHEVYGEAVEPERTGRPGRPRRPYKRRPANLTYATVHKVRENNRVVRVETRVVYGTMAAVVAALAVSLVSAAVNTVFVERHNGSDRHRNSRKVRKTYRFSKDWEAHRAVTLFTMFSANYCRPVRTLRQKVSRERWRQRTPAMAAGLTDRVWSMTEWLSRPSIQHR